MTTTSDGRVEGVVRTRRVCRDFLEDPLPRAALQRLVDAAVRAPSAGNADGLRLAVLTGSDIASYSHTTLGERRGDFRWPGLLRAPVLLVPYVNPDDYLLRYRASDKAGAGLGVSTGAWPVPYWWVDGGMVVQNVLLLAEDNRWGALFFGQFEHEAAVSELTGYSSPWRALGTIALGVRRPNDRSRSRSARTGARSASRNATYGLDGSAAGETP